MIAGPRKHLGRIADRSATVLAFLWTAALRVRLTIQDRFVPVSTIYYATPIIVLAGGAGLTALLFLSCRRRGRALCSACAALGCLIWWHQVSYVSHPGNAGEKGLRILVWNTADDATRRAGIIAQIRQADPDIIALNEFGDGTDEEIGLLRAAFPGYELSDVYYGLILLVRGELVEITNGELGPRGKYKHAVVRIGGQSLNIIQPEIKSNPFRSRATAWQRLNEVAGPLLDQPTMILGDTNTPTDSIHVQWVRERFVNAFEQAGNGHYVTWPMPCPVLAIDHAWVNRYLRVTRCELLWTRWSDHRPILLEVVPAGG